MSDLSEKTGSSCPPDCRNMGTCYVHVKNTKFYIEELNPQRIPGPFVQQNVQCELSAQPDWKELNNFLSAPTLQLKCTNFSSSVQASVIRLLHRGTNQIPSLQAVCNRMLRTLEKLPTQDKTVHRLARQHITCGLLAMQHLPPPIQHIATLVDKAFPTLGSAARLLILQGSHSHYEDIVRASTTELDRQRKSTVALYDLDVETMKKLKQTLQEYGITDEQKVSTDDGVAALQSVIENAFIQLQRFHHSAHLQQKLSLRSDLLARKQERMDAFRKSPVLARRIPFYGRDGSKQSDEPLNEDHKHFLLQCVWRDMLDLDFSLAGDLRDIANANANAPPPTEAEEDEDDTAEVDLSSFTFNRVLERKRDDFNFMLDILAINRAYNMGVAMDDDAVQEEVVNIPIVEKKKDNTSASSDLWAEVDEEGTAALAETLITNTISSGNFSAVVEAGFPSEFRQALLELYTAQVSQLMLAQDEYTKAASQNRIQNLKLGKGFVRQARDQIDGLLSQAEYDEECTKAVFSHFTAYPRAFFELEDQDRDEAVTYVEDRVVNRQTDIEFLKSRINALPHKDAGPQVKRMLAGLLSIAVHLMEGHSLGNIDDVRIKYEWDYALYATSAFGAQRYAMRTFTDTPVPLPNGMLDVFGLSVPASALPCPVAWLADHVSLVSSTDDKYFLDKTLEQFCSYANNFTKITPSGLWDSYTELRDLYFAYSILSTPVSLEIKRLGRMAVRQDPELSAFYRIQLELLREVFTPRSDSVRTWFETDQTPGTVYVMFPPLQTVSSKLNSIAQDYKVSATVASVDALLYALEENEQVLAPGSYHGFIDRFIYALSSLAFYESSMVDIDKVVVGPSLAYWRRNLLNLAITDTMSTHRVDMVPNVPIPSTEHNPAHVSPKLSIEPMPTFILRFLLALRYLRKTILRTFGSGLRVVPRMLAVLGTTNSGDYAPRLLKVLLGHGSKVDKAFDTVMDGWKDVSVDLRLFGVGAEKFSTTECLSARIMALSGTVWESDTNVISNMYDFEKQLVGLYMTSCNELGIDPADISELVGDNVVAEEMDDGDDEDDNDMAAMKSKMARQLQESEAAFKDQDDGFDADTNSWDDVDECKRYASDWRRSLMYDLDMGGDRRRMVLGDDPTNLNVSGVVHGGWLRKLVAITFQTLPRVKDVSDALDPVYPEDREDGQFLSCPRCGWEQSVPTLDESGIFKCSGDQCVSVPEALLVQLEDGSIAPIELQLQHSWAWYPAFFTATAARKWTHAEIRTISDTKRTESAVLSVMLGYGEEKEPLSGIQALVPYELIQELNYWFAEIDKHASKRLSRARIKAYFAATGGEAGFFSGDTMFYYMDRNQDGWIGVAEFRVAILSIYKDNVRSLRVEKIHELRTKFNTLYIQRQESIQEERLHHQMVAERQASIAEQRASIY